METPPRFAHPSASHARPYWESNPPGCPAYPRSSLPQDSSTSAEGGHLRYDPARVDAREGPVEEPKRYPGSMATSPEALSCVLFTLWVSRATFRDGLNEQEEASASQEEGFGHAERQWF